MNLKKSLISGPDLSQAILAHREARLDGKDPVKAWRDVEKALELEVNLRQLPGVAYHSVDISDLGELEKTLEEIRRVDGPIRGVLQAAGTIRDALFDKKDPHWVEQCVKAKIDGTSALMQLTWADPLEYFVAFGSISGRFGANGHTDYSMCNEMMAKLVDWYRRQRPEVAATTFHWHAWGGAGMATRADAELGLQMIAMQFMPGQEGLEHLVKELEAGLPEPEVVITDERYHRHFNPAHSSEQKVTPLLNQALPNGDGWIVEFDPTLEPFLKEHRLHGHPTLPLAVGLELIAETAALSGDGSGPIELARVKTTEALVFYQNTPHRLTVQTEDDQMVRLRTDKVSRDGTLLAKDRLICEAEVRRANGLEPLRLQAPQGEWMEVDYNQKLGFHHGPSLRGLRSFHLEGDVLWGRIVAPGSAYLLSPSRTSHNWCIPSATLDACFYAVGLMWALKTGGGSAPESAQSLIFTRLPERAEECLLRVEQRGDKFDFVLQGENGELLIRAKDYAISALSAGMKAVGR